MSTVMEIQNGTSHDTTDGGENPGLFDQMFLMVVFATHSWEGRRTVKGVKVKTETGEEVSSDRAGKPQIGLAPKPWLKKASDWQQAVYDALKSYTFPCDVPGARLISIKKSGPFIARLNDLIEEGKQLGEQFAEALPEFHAWNWDFWRKEYDTDEAYFQAVGRLIPAADTLRGAFTIEFRLLQPDAGMKTKFESSAVKDFVDQARQNAAAALEDLKEDLVRGPAEALATAFAAMKTKLNTGQRIDDRAFAEIQSALTLCMTFSDDPAVEAKLQQFQKQVTGVVNKAKHAKVTSKNDGGATAVVKAHKATLLAAMDQVINTVQDQAKQAEAMQRFGHLPRGLVFGADLGLGEDD